MEGVLHKFQITGRFGFSKYVVFTTYLEIVYMHLEKPNLGWMDHVLI